MPESGENGEKKLTTLKRAMKRNLETRPARPRLITLLQIMLHALHECKRPATRRLLERKCFFHERHVRSRACRRQERNVDFVPEFEMLILQGV